MATGRPVDPTLPPALLLGGQQAAVSAARSLAEAGVTVHAVGGPQDPVRVSRACSSYTVITHRPGLTRTYLEWLEHGPRGAVILPCDDESLELIGQHRATLEAWGYTAVEADDEVLLAMLDKERTYELSRRAGIPTPRTMTIRSREDAEEAADTFDYPCALKPVLSHTFRQQAPGPAKVLTVTDRADLLTTYEETQHLGVQFLVTEIIPGRDEDFCSFYAYMLPDGSPLYQLTKHKLRQLPIGFGLTCYQETVREPEVADLGLRFFQSVGLRGVGNVEFKKDSRDGQWKIIECNHRFTLANEIIRLAGVDVPLIAYRRAIGQHVEPIEDYRLVRMWNPIEDTKAFLQYREAGELTFPQWVGSLMTRWHLPMLDLRDPLPTMLSLSTRVPGVMAAVVEGLRGRGSYPLLPGRS